MVQLPAIIEQEALLAGNIYSIAYCQQLVRMFHLREDTLEASCLGCQLIQSSLSSGKDPLAARLAESCHLQRSTLLVLDVKRHQISAVEHIDATSGGYPRIAFMIGYYIMHAFASQTVADGQLLKHWLFQTADSTDR
jgi:hypothetical protein